MGRRRSCALAAVALWLALVAAGCGLLSSEPLLIDGLSVGVDAGCGACDQPPTSPDCGACESIATIARRRVDERWPSHPPITSLTFHREGGYPGPSGGMIINTRSGSLTVAVATFGDGTRHAVSVYCGVGGCR
jgi:hypothetical protein